MIESMPCLAFALSPRLILVLHKLVLSVRHFSHIPPNMLTHVPRRQLFPAPRASHGPFSLTSHGPCFPSLHTLCFPCLLKTRITTTIVQSTANAPTSFFLQELQPMCHGTVPTLRPTALICSAHSLVRCLSRSHWPIKKDQKLILVEHVGLFEWIGTEGKIMHVIYKYWISKSRWEALWHAIIISRSSLINQSSVVFSSSNFILWIICFFVSFRAGV